MICSIIGFSGCSLLDDAVDNTVLKQENERLKEENQALKQELASLKFEITYPEGIITGDCILNNVVITRDIIKTDTTVSAIKVVEANVTINNGSYDGGQGSAANVAVFANNNSTVVINGGEFKVGYDKDSKANSTIYAANASHIVINGGIFHGVADESGNLWTLNCQNNSGSSIIVKGGTFIDFNPAEAYTDDNGANVAVSYLAEGYTVECEVINQGTADEYRLYSVIEAVEPDPEIPEEF